MNLNIINLSLFILFSIIVLIECISHSRNKKIGDAFFYFITILCFPLVWIFDKIVMLTKFRNFRIACKYSDGTIYIIKGIRRNFFKRYCIITTDYWMPYIFDYFGDYIVGLDEELFHKIKRSKKNEKRN